MAHHLTTPKDDKPKYTEAVDLRAAAPKNSLDFFQKGLRNLDFHLLKNPHANHLIQVQRPPKFSS